MEIFEDARNIHVITHNDFNFKIAMLSDIHWDNPKCDRDKLKTDLDYCLKHKIPVMINGDFFCLMQGKYDPRRNKKDIRPEHNKHDYIDAVINTAVDWWKPYAHIITVISYGNHETGIIKNLETDPLQRFVDLLNRECKTHIKTGGYGGWIIINLSKNGTRTSFKIKYFHGSGGGGIVTKGAINLTRAKELYESFDVFTMGHVHENSARNDVREVVEHTKNGYRHRHKQIHLMITGTYKEEYQDGAFGWHVERGAPIKHIGGRILELNIKRINNELHRYINSSEFN